jgi:hypothetical protein
VKAEYITPVMSVTVCEAIHILKGSLVVDNDEEHDGWADAKPRTEGSGSLDCESADYGDLWK